MAVIKESFPRRGDRCVLVTPPLEWYAGKVGVAALIEEVSESAVYVLFDGGLRESYPPARFAEYFRPEVAPGASVSDAKGAGAANTRATGLDHLHR